MQAADPFESPELLLEDELPEFQQGRTALRRNPLVWALALELCVSIALVVVAWHVVTSHRLTAPSIPVALPFVAPSPSPLPALALPPAPATHPGRAALRHDPAFVRAQVARLNHEQSLWEKAQWMLVSSLTGVARAYLERVVVPAVEQASQGRK